MNMLTHGHVVATEVTGIDAVIIKNLEASAKAYEMMNQPETSRFCLGYAKYVKERHLAPKPNGLSRKQLKKIKREENRMRRYEASRYNEDFD